MEIKDMRIEDIEKRMSEIEVEKTNPEADLEALTEEVRALKEQKNKLLTDAEARLKELNDIATGEVETETIKTFEEERKMDKIYTIESPEYRSGFLKTMLDKELTEEERSAVSYVATTGDTTHGAAYVLPREMLNQIWDLIDDQHSILGDITMYRTGTILEIAKRTSISQGDAASVNENAANDDEINEFAKVTLTGKDFSKHVDISYAMAAMSIEAFESFLVAEISERMGAALANDVIATINSGYDTDHNAVSTATALKMAYADIAGALATLKNAKGQCTVYASHATIYKYLVGMVDTTGRPIFQPNAQAGAEGYLVGCPVKVEDGITGDVLLIGYPAQVVGNMIQDIMVESDKNIKKHVITYAGYARFECVLMAPAAFAKLTVSPS